MIGLVLVTHGGLAVELISAMEHVVGPQENTAAVCIGPNDDMEHRRADIQKAVSSVETGEGVIILTDMFGGTPSNLAISIMEAKSIEVIAGVNLPILVKLASIRSTLDLQSAIAKAQEAGRKYINVASHLLNENKN